MKHNDIDFLFTKMLLILGTFTGFTTKYLENIDLIASIILKLVSILSFTIVIIINMPKFIKTIKEWLN